MKPRHKHLLQTHGPLAVVLGASEGIGLAFAEELAAAGFRLLLASRRPEPLDRAAERLRDRYGVEVRTTAADLSESGTWAKIRESAAPGDIGLVVYNAAASPIGPFLDLKATSVGRTVSVNIAAPLEVLHDAGNLMRRRFTESGRRGGVILMSSLSGLRGTPYISAYAASKAWAMILAEGVGRETAGEGVDILACVAGATDTPGYRDSLTGRSVAPVQSPTAVAREALAVLGRRNLLITGRMNRLIARFVYGLMPREWGSRILTKAAGSLRRRDDAGLGYSSGAEIRIRRSESIDLPFMREMLYEAVYWRSIGEGTNPPPEEGLSVPAVAAGLENWGRRPGDTAVIALLESKPVGAAWYRFYTGDHSIRGYIADNVPVLAMAVHRDHRRAGIGETLISGLMTEASKQKVSRISLMVSNDNTAGRLYEKCGFTCYEEVGDSMLMIRDIPD